MTKFFATDCRIESGGGKAIASVVLENGDTRDIYGKMYSDRGTWPGEQAVFGPEYCYFSAQGKLWRRELDILDFGIYPPDEYQVDEEPAYYEVVGEWREQG